MLLLMGLVGLVRTEDRLVLVVEITSTRADSAVMLMAMVTGADTLVGMRLGVMVVVLGVVGLRHVLQEKIGESYQVRDMH